MDMFDHRDIFDIRFVKIHFYLTIVEDTVMPRDKVSGFRGGIGEMLLRGNCIRNRKCETCDFETECLVRKIMYSKSPITPRSASEGESLGYVFECENKQEIFEEGEELKLSLLLFGNNILYLQQYILALSALGNEGIGKNKSRFVISGITNTKQEALLAGSSILMENYKVETIKDYIAYRKRQLGQNTSKLRIDFLSPTAIKYQGEMLKEYDITALYKAAVRRVYMLDCFEGIVFDEEWNSLEIPCEIESQRAYEVSVQRFSNHKEQHMKLNGLQGQVVLNCDYESPYWEAFLMVMLAGEILHIGKNTSFGFGRIRIKEQ